MEKTKNIYCCKQCGYESANWQGKCPSCGEWNSFKEIEKIIGKGGKTIALTSPSSAEPTLLSEVSTEKGIRIKTGNKEFDGVLGGGIVPGMVTLLGGEPGVGKSTLMIQLADWMAKQKLRTLYISGEESPSQIKLRTQRLGITGENIKLFCTTNTEDITFRIENEKPDLVVIDSIQSTFTNRLDSIAGSITQMRENTAVFTRMAKELNIPMFIIGHITKDGVVAGPKLIEHAVDTVLYFETDSRNYYKILRTTKNRFGSTNEIGIFKMSQNGLEEVDNPNFIFLNEEENAIGTSVGCILEGSRVFLAEVQSLVNAANYGNPQRVANGIDHKKLALYLAIIEKNLGITLRMFDVFVSLMGGIKASEPSLDLAVIASILSSFKDMPIPGQAVFIGEVSLSGIVRPVSMVEKKISEALKLGYEKVFVSSGSKLHKQDTRVIKIEHISEIMRNLF
jgi:DNA repair protein RadA/Sms